MARYIDADKLIEHILTLRVVTDNMYGMGITRGIERAKTAIEMQPTADVVPKSEYDEVLSSWQKIHDSYDTDCIEHYKYGRAEVAREIFEEIESISSDFPLYGNINTVILSERDLAFIKKKYTEGKDEQASTRDPI